MPPAGSATGSFPRSGFAPPRRSTGSREIQESGGEAKDSVTA
jgi:hypothetical protein